jgi:lipopolysaccharide heptosyltransferase II
MMTTPALAALKAGAPDRHITLLASRSGAALAPHLPVDTVIEAAVPWMKPGDPLSAAGCAELIEELRARAFDAAIIFTVHSQNPLPAAMLCYQAGIGLRAAYCRENAYHLLSDRLPEQEPQLGIRHEVERQLALVRSLGFEPVDTHLQFHLRDGDRAALARTLATIGAPRGGPYIVIHPGASASARRYPAERFGAALRLLAQRSPLPVFITGAGDETEIAATVINHAGDADVHDVSGRLTVGELGALIAGAGLLISNNSGPVHLAAALGTPVVDLYALTNPQHTPWQVPSRVLFHDVPCRYCMKNVCPQQHHACLRRVTPGEIAEAALQLLHSPGRGRKGTPLAALPRYRLREESREIRLHPGTAPLPAGA